MELNPEIYDHTLCSLGEGPLWHPLRKSLFWFDINGHTLFEKVTENQQIHNWKFDNFVSAAGWVDDQRLLIGKKGALILFNLETEEQKILCDLEASNPNTRPNDGRADPYGGFWIGTMGIEATKDAGAIYRYFKGELRQLYSPWTIPNSICFAPCGKYAYLVDTPLGQVMKQKLDDNGWPKGELELFLALPNTNYFPDGAVVDSDGNLWIAHYGFGKVTQFSSDGKELQTINFPAKQTTCPAFGGENLSTLFVTSASQNMNAPGDNDGSTFAISTNFNGQAEHQVIL